MKKYSLIKILFLSLFIMAGTASAKDKWVTVAHLTPAKAAKEVSINKVCSFIQFEIIEGSVGFHTFWIREPNGVKNQITVNARFNAGEKYTFEVTNPRMITGLRISDFGKGTYKLWVKERR